MAESSNAQSTVHPHAASEVEIPSSLKFLMNNLKNIDVVSLTAENYPIWSAQVLKLFTANGFADFLTGATPCPPKFLTSPNGELCINPDYQRWQMVDQNLAAALYSTISVSVLPHVLNLDTTAAIWSTLIKRLQATNGSRVIQLKNELHHLSLKNSSMTQYLSEVKTIVDHISAARSNVDTEDIILYILNGLPSPYQPFKSAIRTRSDPISLDELYSLLLSEEVNLATEASRDASTSQFALHTSTRRRSNNYHGRGRSSGRGGRYTPQTGNRSNIVCQICHKVGHLAFDCWHRTNLDISPPTKNPNRSALLANNPNSSWVLDSGATSHLTPHLQHVLQPEPYQGNDHIAVGDGSTILITHSGSGILPTPSGSLHQSSTT